MFDVEIELYVQKSIFPQLEMSIGRAVDQQIIKHAFLFQIFELLLYMILNIDCCYRFLCRTLRSVAQTYLRPKLGPIFCIFHVFRQNFQPTDMSSCQNTQFDMQKTTLTSKIARN